MEYAFLGNTGVKISRLALGTMNFGMVTDKSEAAKIMSRALDLGINFFDTSNSYGGYENRGASELMLGSWLLKNQKRNQVFLASKVYHKTVPFFNNVNDECGVSAYKIVNHLEESLKRLKTDHIDLYQLHHMSCNSLSEEVMLGLERAFFQGKINYTGSCNFSAFILGQYQLLAEKRNALPLVSEQHKYNLLCRLPELEILPAVRSLGISLLAWSPLNAGMLSSNAFMTHEGTRASHNKFSFRLKTQIEKYQRECKDFGLSPQQVAIAWLLKKKEISSVIIGPRTLNQLNDYKDIFSINLPVELLNKLDKIFPSPGGEAPVAYAW